MHDSNASRTAFWKQPLTLFAVAAALAVFAGLAVMIRSAEKLDEQLDRQAADANQPSSSQSPSSTPDSTAARQSAKPAAPSTSADLSPPGWLWLDQRGEPCEVTLAHRTVLKLDTDGEECQGYDFRPPITLYDPKLEMLIDFKNVRGHGNGVMCLNLDAKHDRLF